MALLRVASNEMAYGKIGLLGFAGAGKTYTAALIAIGLHKWVKSKKPVAFLDTETGSDFVLPLFRAAGIELLIAKTKSFKDLLSFMEEAEQTADIAIVDSVSHVWQEIQDAYLARINEGREKKITRLEFQHWGPIKAEWRKFTDRYLNAKMHTILCGRAGYIYDYEQFDEDAKKELVKTGVKMKAETEMAYEPSLLIEMERVQVRGDLGGIKKKKGIRSVANRAYVVKDRADVLDGKLIDNPTFESFLPHFEALNIGGEHRASDVGQSSTGLFDQSGDSEWTREKRAREKWMEEIQGLLTSKYPGQGADEKKKKVDLIYQFLGTRSWTAVEQMKADDIRGGYEAMKTLLEGAV